MFLVSIITPLYNSERFIDTTIKSVLSQTYTNWELIIVDDGSTDKGFDIAHQHHLKDCRIRLFKQDRNSGAAACRNTAIEKARGKYIAFLDSDDLWEPNKLMTQINKMNETGAVFTFTSYKLIDEEGIELDKIVRCPESLVYKQQLRYNHIGCLTAMYNADGLGKLYMPIIRKRQDYALWLKILKLGVVGVGIDECLATYRIRKNSLSSNKFELLKWNWRLYREVENLSVTESGYYLCCNIFNKLKTIT